MARHFLGLYLLIVLTLAAVSWGQDRLLDLYGKQDSTGDRGLMVAMTLFADQLREAGPQERNHLLSDMAKRIPGDMEILATSDITGRDTLEKLKAGGIAEMQAAGESWVMKQVDASSVLALKTTEAGAQREPWEWGLTLLFYAAIALVLMIWIWPLTRDLRALEVAASQFGNRNWKFDAQIGPRSQIYPLARTFRLMAGRIDGLIASHKHMSNAVSHEIKTPLARMKFEIELAQQSDVLSEVKNALGHIKEDIGAIDDLVTATLDYAILERAEMSLNIGRYNFSTIIPAIIEQVGRDVGPGIHIACDVPDDATQVACDMHLFESVLKNLLYNAARYAKGNIQVIFSQSADRNQLLVDDDGPGIAEEDKGRAFESFVQLDQNRTKKTGFGLGLSIVKQAAEWHGGDVVISRSPLGGARFCATWPVRPISLPEGAHIETSVLH